MTLIVLYLLAVTALCVSLAFIPLILVTSVPLTAVYYHALIRKPVVWGLALVTLSWQSWLMFQAGSFLWPHAGPLALTGAALFILYNLYPSIVFRAVDNPVMSTDPLSLPIPEDAEMAIIECNGITKAYPLDYLIHGHIINDRFGDRTLSLTYCALCRSVIPFDVTDIGPLYVGAMKNGNMVLADCATGTFFQQGTFESVIGPLHPRSLEMVFFQLLSWAQVKNLDHMPEICHVTERDFRPFALPIPGLWEKLTKGELTPGLSSKKRDKSMPARLPVIGVIDPTIHPQIVYRKEDITKHGVVKNDDQGVTLISLDGVVSAFKSIAGGQMLDLGRAGQNTIQDTVSGTRWDLRGKHIDGAITSDLEMIMISDEYWYSWKFFHPRSKLIDL